MLASIAIIGGYAVFYALLHSWLATPRVKAWVLQRGGSAAERGYRLAYNLMSTVLLLPFVPLLLWLPDQVLYTLPAPWFWLALLGQVGALLGIAYGIWLTDALYFLGVRQFFGQAATGQVRPQLVVRGVYRWVRHPLYFFGLLLIWLTPQMTLNRLVLCLIFSLYLYVGTFFEEQRLVAEFGAAYRAYQRQVPRLLPWRWRSRYTPNHADPKT